MCVNSAHSCASCYPSSNDPLGEDVLSSNHAQRQVYISNHPDLSSHDAIPIPLTTTPRLPFEGNMSTDQESRSALHLAHTQQPPDYIIDYWFHYLGLSLDPTSLETPSHLPTFPFSLPVLNDIDAAAALSTSNSNTVTLENPLTPTGEPQGHSGYLSPPLDRVHHDRPQPHGVVRHQPQVIHKQQAPKRRAYDRPGRKPAAEYEPDPLKLQTSCQLHGGTDYACQWIRTVFKDGVTLEALVRPLNFTEIEHMNFAGGFEPSLAYDGFLQKTDYNGFECCLCTADKRARWKNKKDSIRHLRKFHFGLADRCDTCHKRIYSTGEMTSHRCVKLATPSTSMGLGTNPYASLDIPPT